MNPRAPPAASASFVVRIEERHGRRRYLLHDLRSGEVHRFTLAVHLQRWLRRQPRSRLRRPLESRLPMPAATLHILGSPHVEVDGRRHELPNRVPGFLAAWLALRADWVSRDAPCLVFWPERDESQALHNLRVNLHRLKAWLAERGLEDALQAEKRRLRLTLPCDAVQLRGACGAGDWEQALALYRGPLLEGCSLAGMPAVDEWLHAQRGLHETAWRDAAQHLALQWQAAGRAADAARLLQQQLDHDLLAEDLLQALLRVAPAAGCIEPALALHARFAQRLAAELGHAPLPATDALVNALRAGAPVRSAPPAGTRQLAARLAAPALVGRRAETERLRALPPGRLLVIRGEPGAGKTRLVESGWPSATWLHAQPGAAPLQPLADHLHDHLEALRERPVFERHRRVLARLVPAALPGEPLPPTGADGAALIAALVDLFHDAGRPLVVDDLQWADGATLQLVSALLRDGRLPLAATLRLGHAVDALDDWLAEGRAERLDLAPLAEGDVAALVAELSAQRGGAPRFARWLHARSAGNPFFALETLRALFAEGHLRADADGWHSVLDTLSPDYAELALPPRVAEVVRLRVLALGEGTQRVLQVCAVAGHARWLGPLAQAAGLSPLALGAALGEAQCAGVLNGREFAHDLVREALLDAMPEALRAGVHATWLRHAAAQLGPHEQAAHAWASGDAPRAVAATVAAARLDATRGLQEPAWALLHQSLARTDEAVLRAALHATAAVVRLRQGRFDEADAEAVQALDDLPDPADRALALSVRGEVAMAQGRVQAVAPFVAAALEADPTLDEARMLRMNLAHAQGDYAGAEALLREWIAQLRRARPTPELAVLLTSLGSSMDFQGRYAEALPVHREALALARRIGARYTEVEVAVNIVWCLPELGLHDEAMALGEQALALGEFDATPTLMNNLAWLYLQQGRLDDAARLYRRLADGNEPTVACVADAKLLQILAQQSRADEALVQARALLERMRKTDHARGRAIAVLALLDHGPSALHAEAIAFLPPVPVDAELQARLDAALARHGLAATTRAAGA